jgi:aminobenzoyl-glutamate utilization protein B
MQAGLKWIDDHTPQLTSLAQAIWQFAEVSYQETRSAAAQISFLEDQGFSIERGVAGMPTAFIASFGRGKPIIGYLGEYDALLGLSQKVVAQQEPVQEGAPGHGCGHNLLGVASLAAAAALKVEIEAGRAAGTVRYYGCPAEESGAGKAFMARDGLFNDLDAAITWHPGSFNSATYRGNLAINSVRFAFHGRASHAGGSPHMGISALDAVELMNTGANFLREHVIQDARIHYVITKGGDQPNVVPAYAEVWYYVRAPQRRDVEEIYQRIVKIAEGAALMTGARLEIKFQDGLYSYLANPVICDVLQESMEQVGGPVFSDEDKAFAKQIEATFIPGQKVSMLSANHVPPEYWGLTLHEGVAPPFDKGTLGHGSTDVGDVSWITPTGQISTATCVVGTPGHSWQMAACAGTGIGHKGMLAAARTMALAGYRLATTPDLLAKARDAFMRDTGGQPYKSPIPPDVHIPL